jgi:hypothetical protein
MSIQVKLTALLFTQAKAVIFVTDPKSGASLFEEQNPGISGELNSSRSLKGEKTRTFQYPNMPKIMFVTEQLLMNCLKERVLHLKICRIKLILILNPIPSRFLINS